MTEPRNEHRPRAPRRTKAYDLDVVGRLDRVTTPKQLRSEASLQRVLAALEALLQAKPFSAISLPEIAARAGCSAATIYGRFKDKDSILAALHESLREQLMQKVDASLHPERWTGQGFDALAAHYCSDTTRFYAENRHLLAAVLLISDEEVYGRAALSIQHISQRMSATAQHLLPPSQHAGLDARVDLGVRAVFALLQQRLLFEPVRLSRLNDGSDATFSAELAQLLTRMVVQPA